jgi:hypothetical protein
MCELFLRAMNHVRTILYGVATICVAGLGGCNNPLEPIPHVADKIPMIYNIGDGTVLTFKEGKDLEIPVEISTGWNHRIWPIDVMVSGTSPLTLGKKDEDNGDYFVKWDDSGPTKIVIKAKYFTKDDPNTGDILSVQVVLRKKVSPNDELDAVNYVRGLINDKDRLDANGALTEESLNEIMQNPESKNFPISIHAGLDSYLQKAKQFKGTKDGNQIKELTGLRKDITRNFEDYSPSITATSSRITKHFILYKVEDYRNDFIAGIVKPLDYQAVLLSKGAARQLFGDRVSEEYYVISLSIRNRSSEPIVISSGMIEIMGSAIVTPAEGSTERTLYSIPVRTSTTDWQHLYTVVSDTSPYTERNTIFRVMTVAGSIAGAFSPFTGTASDFTQLVSIYGNNVVPGLEQVWPDGRPRNLYNIAQFSMPELVRIAGNDRSVFRFIYVSRKDLEVVVADALNYSQCSDTQSQKSSQRPAQKSSKYTQSGNAEDADELERPNTQIVHIDLHMLRIPIDVAPAEKTTSLSTQLDAIEVRLREARKNVSGVTLPAFTSPDSASVIKTYVAKVNATGLTGDADQLLSRDALLRDMIKDTSRTGMDVQVNVLDTEVKTLEYKANLFVAVNNALKSTRLDASADEIKKDLKTNSTVEGFASSEFEKDSPSARLCEWLNPTPAPAVTPATSAAAQ